MVNVAFWLFGAVVTLYICDCFMPFLSSFDRPSILKDNGVAIASLFGVISAILWKKFKEHEKLESMLRLSMP